MFTQCPQCDAIFQLTAIQLKAANGDVRCGQCLTVFSALDHLSEEVPHTEEADSPDELAHDANQYRDWTEDAAEKTEQDTTPTDEPAAATPAENDLDESDDVFSEVIAEVSASNIPAVEIDRFEAFLATQSVPAEEVPAENAPAVQGTPNVETALPADDAFSTVGALPAEDAIAIEGFSPAEGSSLTEGALLANGTLSVDTLSSTEGALPIETPRLTDEDLLAESVEDAFPDTLRDGDAAQVENPAVATQSEPDSPLSHDFAGSFSSDDAADATPAAIEETHFGDVDAVNAATADLDAEISFDDDEFAELDAYLNGSDSESSQSLVGAASQSGIDDDSIIIEAADLEPVTSPAYADTPEQAAAANTSPPPENTQTPAPNEPQTINIPTLILDDLHAAKAEQLRPANTPWVIGSLVLMLVLVLQVVYHTRDDLAKDASLRPWLIQMCNIVGCTLNQPYDVKQIEIIGRDVRSHPTARKALVVSTTLINNASFVQPFPLLTITFSDITGSKIAQRRFTPREYLHNDIDLAAGMTPDMPVRVELEIVDPGKAAVNYEFRAEVDPRRTRPLT